MPHSSNDRSYEYDIKYLRKVLSRIDGDIVLPNALRGDVLRAKIESESNVKPKIAVSAMEFLRSQVFSLQSVVSYALAFVVIMLVTYSMGRGTPDLIDGSIHLQQELSANQAGGIQASGVPEAAETTAEAVQTDSAAEPHSQSSPSGDAPADSGSRAETDAFTAAADAPAENGDAGGVGGGGEAEPLGEDGRYSYICRVNDQTDPFKAGIPLTLEIVDVSTSQLAGYVDIPDLTQIEEFFLTEHAMGFVGVTGGVAVTRVYALDAIGPDMIPLFDLSQPGALKSVREYDDYLHIVTVSESAPEDISVEQLPESQSETCCVITAVDLSDGAYSQIAYAGVEDEKLVSVQNRNIFISYEAIAGEGDEPALYTVQIKLDGTEYDMVLVP